VDAIALVVVTGLAAFVDADKDNGRLIACEGTPDVVPIESAQRLRHQ
jgi:hypothetical protein